jgi:hypothetical protein
VIAWVVTGMVLAGRVARMDNATMGADLVTAVRIGEGAAR